MKNSYWIVGKHAVKAALNNTQRTKIRLCTTKEIKLANYNLKGLATEILSKDQISKIIGNSTAHQGIALQVKNLKHGPWDQDGRREIYKKAELTE